mmetsp:Transcript_21/g.44  ORF Transcript_21/g.44 Transcript_21/m.44 type:complete len:121 (-) Transcript_21:501-863(-)|eukprot:CAMPEP_0170197952 /NCGR_PEP_ID=MMETSP0040_2-20121228/67619_1 /TAXON_ID=641309 /ORGANISM="Lotharella oceanica, Strain CCMP622" /LENGTH=120 /DNA_ID=CAMNT_0010447771 /DNA_START=28 /DNA_END=390 /DNA_ORIENTATION=+
MPRKVYGKRGAKLTKAWKTTKTTKTTKASKAKKTVKTSTAVATTNKQKWRKPETKAVILKSSAQKFVFQLPQGQRKSSRLASARRRLQASEAEAPKWIFKAPAGVRKSARLVTFRQGLQK